MTQPSIRELAKQGNAKAITILLQRGLESQGITVKAGTKKNGLMVFLESDQVPEKQASVEFIKKEVESLGVALLQVIKVYGRRKGDEQIAWIKEFEIAALVSPPLPLPDGCILRQATSKDRFKLLKTRLSSLADLLSLKSLAMLGTVWLFLHFLKWDNPLIIVLFLLLILLVIFDILTGSLEGVWLIESKGRLIAYGELNNEEIQNILRPRHDLSLLANVLLFTGFTGFSIFAFVVAKELLLFSLLLLLPSLLMSIVSLIQSINYTRNSRSKKTINYFRKKSYISYLFVESAWRRKGLGSAIVERLIQEANRPVYVMPVRGSVGFYTRLGFVQSDLDKRYMIYK